MTIYKCGDIILAKVIFSEGEGVKKRPALVLSSDRYHEKRQEIIIAAITGNISRILTTEDFRGVKENLKQALGIY